MKKLESTFMNMVLSLVLIAAVAAAALAGVFTLTNDAIEQQKTDKVQKAILEVLPQDIENIFIAPADTLDKKKDLIIYRAFTDSTMATPIGAAVKISEIGFGGKFKLMVGFDTENRIINYSVLEHQETPGLGDKMGKWFNDSTKAKSYVPGLKAGKLEVSKEGGEIDAITAATISSKAFLRAVNAAHAAYIGNIDAATGASQQHHEATELTPEDTVNENDSIMNIVEKEADNE